MTDSARKNKWVAFILSMLCLHRFYVGRIGSGILQIITLGGFGIWILIDVILILTGNFKDANGNLLT
jgi:TM2 domain-containing membrane protein YozV